MSFSFVHPFIMARMLSALSGVRTDLQLGVVVASAMSIKVSFMVVELKVGLASGGTGKWG